MKNRKLALILGIRPDVIRASLLIKALKAELGEDLQFIWSGQHYSDNLKDVFFRELEVPQPDIELGARGGTDAEVAASVITRLYPVLEQLQPRAAIFLGDTNTVIGCLAAAQLNIPIVHIEGCMRSYDWRMPEEKYRSTIDHLSDVIYTYFDEYKAQGIAEGINPGNIVVVGNLIVDVLNEYYFKREAAYRGMATPQFFAERALKAGEYFLLTCHRRENVENRASFLAILNLIAQAPLKVYFPASYRTQKVIERLGVALPSNVTMIDPIGYKEMLALLVNSAGVITDSGTVVEETCVLGVPSLQMRRSTERPQVYDARSSVKFDPAEPEKYPPQEIFKKLAALRAGGWSHNLGDGQSSRRILSDLLDRLKNDGFQRHRKEFYHLPVARSYRGDDL